MPSRGYFICVNGIAFRFTPRRGFSRLSRRTRFFMSSLGIAWSASNFGANNNLFGAVYGILDTGPESLIPTWPLVLRVEFLEPTGVKWSRFAQNVDPGPNAYQKPENRGGLERPNRVVFSNDGKTMYVVDYGEVYTNFQMPTPFYTVAKSGVIWTITYTGSN